MHKAIFILIYTPRLTVLVCANTAKTLPLIYYFIHLLSYLILHYSFMFNLMQWIIPKKSLIHF